MNIHIIELHCNNFKNLTARCKTNGKSYTIFGGNGKGKTTLWDAFAWVLFDEDSAGRSNFQIKSLDKDGNPQHHMEHTVEVHLVIDGESLLLKKTYLEKRKKTDDEDNQGQLEGHTTHCMEGNYDYQREHTPALNDPFPSHHPKPTGFHLPESRGKNYTNDQLEALLLNRKNRGGTPHEPTPEAHPSR